MTSKHKHDIRTDWWKTDRQTYAFLELLFHICQFIEKSNPFFYTVIGTHYLRDRHPY